MKKRKKEKKLGSLTKTLLFFFSLLNYFRALLGDIFPFLCSATFYICINYE